MMAGRASGWMILLAALTFTGVFSINFCGWIYRCGCQSIWAGAARHCNIHIPSTKHCPLCVLGKARQAVVFAFIVIPQSILSFRPSRWSWPRRLLAAMTAFPVIFLLIAAPLGWTSGYWE